MEYSRRYLEVPMNTIPPPLPVGGSTTPRAARCGGSSRPAGGMRPAMSTRRPWRGCSSAAETARPNPAPAQGRAPTARGIRGGAEATHPTRGPGAAAKDARRRAAGCARSAAPRPAVNPGRSRNAGRGAAQAITCVPYRATAARPRAAPQAFRPFRRNAGLAAAGGMLAAPVRAAARITSSSGRPPARRRD